MLNIKIDDKYQITSDERNYILNEIKTAKSGKNEGKKYIDPVSYHGSLGDLLRQYANVRLLKSDCNSFEEIRGILTEIFKTISDIQSSVSLNRVI